MSSIAEFFKELQRRSVIRAAVFHVLSFWLLVQVADVVLPYIGIVDDPVRWAILAGVGLFPLTLIVAWFFEHPWTSFTRGRLVTDIIVIALIGVGVCTWVLRNLPQVVHTRTSIVVMPFTHSGDDTEKSLSRALASEINSLLMRSRSIDVIGFESATSSVLEGLDTMAIADRLNVQHVLAGSIAADGVNLRIEMQLLDRAGDALWNSIIEDSLANLFSIQEDIATSVESRLGAGDRTIPVAEVAANRCWIPNDPEAIDKYFTARTYADLRTESEESKEQVRTAIRSYEELIEEYPNFAEAYTGLAWAQMHQGVYDAENALPNRHELAIGLATQALQHCPTLTEAIHILPNQWDHENGWISTHRQLAAFIELEPHRTENYQRLARFYRETGFFDRALAVAERDYQLNPLGPRTIKELGFTLQKLRRWDEAIAKFDLAAELGSTGPNWPRLTVNWSNCGGDITCLLDNLPSEMEPLRERFAKIYIEPANEMEAEAAVDAAMELVREIDLVNWFNGSSCQVDYLTPLFYELFDYYVENEGQIYWHMPNTWNPECGRVWSDPRFRDVVEELRLDELWREIGWPQACQPDGDSFTCGAG